MRVAHQPFIRLYNCRRGVSVETHHRVLTRESKLYCFYLKDHRVDSGIKIVCVPIRQFSTSPEFVECASNVSLQDSQKAWVSTPESVVFFGGKSSCDLLHTLAKSFFY